MSAGAYYSNMTSLLWTELQWYLWDLDIKNIWFVAMCSEELKIFHRESFIKN